MSAQGLQNEQVSATVENVGGIAETEVTFDPGVTILTGRNATNRTSFLQAIMAALGSDQVSLKSDADEGHVELSVGDEAFTRTFERQGDTVVASGDPYLDDATLADLFAFLLESNDARRAVATDGDLRSIIMEPVDTAAISAEIDRLVERREEIERELAEIDELATTLPGLEEERTRLESEIEETEADLVDIEAEIEAADTDVEERQETQSAVEETLSDLQDRRSTLDDVRFDLETEQESLEQLRSERRELEEELSNLPEAPTGELEEVESELDALRSRKRELESKVTEIHNIIAFNEELLEEGVSGALASDGDDDGELTDQLLEGDQVECWTCGSTVDREQIEATIGQLRELVQDKRSAVSDLESEIEELQSRGKELQSEQDRRDEIERRLRSVETEIGDAEDAIDRLQERREEVTEEIEDLEAELEEREDDGGDDEVLELHKEANQLEYELGKLESERDRVAENIASIEDRLDEHDELQDRREAIGSEIEDLRTKIDRIEREAVEAFNEHMDTVLELLGYDNLERIWIERVETQVREGRQKVDRTQFDLHVVRATASGATYEDTVDNLSESEREVTGLVFALAGYLAHDLYEVLPFLVLDSVEALDADRIAWLVDYLSDYADYLVVALLPEDAQSLDEDYQRVTEI
jgi:septal ring factor EnvC (AmiA/AmiB activator)/copper chaperone CopZ